MKKITRKGFLGQMGLMGASIISFGGCDFSTTNIKSRIPRGAHIDTPLEAEDIFSFIRRLKGKMDISLYRKIIGAANEFKEGDQTIGVAAADETSCQNARTLLGNTLVNDLEKNPLFKDGILDLIQNSVTPDPMVQNWTVSELKQFILSSPEEQIKEIMPGLSSDIIACVVKLMTNEELISVGQKVFNPLPNSNIGSEGYMSARVQPNSPTDDIEDIAWQVFDAWSYGVGDLVLGTNPVSSEVDSVARIEAELFDIISTFGLEESIPNCVLSHIDIQAAVEEIQPGTTGIWFQSLAGTENANKTFDVTIEKMFQHMDKRKGPYGLYAETGQGADFTNGHGQGFDMLVHESRKYGFLRALKLHISKDLPPEEAPWVHVNDVAGFIGPEVFKTREQLVRCCLEDTAMGKLHGLTIGLDLCSTLHMDVNLRDLDWCIEQVMPANPAYLMALPTKNDPMLSYLTTAFHNHLKVREQFGYKVNDVMWDFFKKIEVIDNEGQPTSHFGDPLWVYYQYRLAKEDPRSKEEIYKEGRECLARIRKRGVPIAEGYGENIWDQNPELEREVERLYEDAKVSLWTEMPASFVASIPAPVAISSKSHDRIDYVYHPESGERLSTTALKRLESMLKTWGSDVPELQIIISDGLNARALMDEGHLMPFLDGLTSALKAKDYRIGKENIVIRNGRVRAGYACGELLFGHLPNPATNKGIIHVIGERPGSGHHNFSAYLTVTTVNTWSKKGTVDHNITRVVSGISDSALKPEQAIQDILGIIEQQLAPELSAV
ncbi:ethanolamine ammonia-lyase subunit EutB [Poritiphilus flavus]|uniref:Ethanolamine ammonia-lyase subunit EutB n=1 Tax=Poritiphilus flavus TaxID=2697053 RepID=A0A6L9EEW7_9FLAO|nr:ethanolamine ammonia-lyase subunit EutB [Poritiphilus flavus]NAS13314.1 ethanolamine ammonia-lyase subunit EutB [Poritiphilus flavus]